jgi:hypothetical protein
MNELAPGCASPCAVEAFDHIDLIALHATLGDLGLADQFDRALYLKLEGILGPPMVAHVKMVTPTVKLPPKPRYKVTRFEATERRIKMGLEFLSLRSQAKSNRAYGQLRSNAADVEQALAAEATRVAERYGQRPEIWRQMSWNALVELSSPSLPAAARKRFESRVLAGDEVKGAEIAKARGPLRNGRPRQEHAMAA